MYVAGWPRRRPGLQRSPCRVPATIVDENANHARVWTGAGDIPQRLIRDVSRDPNRLEHAGSVAGVGERLGAIYDSHKYTSIWTRESIALALRRVTGTGGWVTDSVSTDALFASRSESDLRVRRCERRSTEWDA